MRYRRYHSHRNSDGSRTVVSAGPIASGYMGFVKLVLGFGVLAWPAIVCGEDLSRPVAWVVGVASELVWLVILAIIWTVYEGSKR